MDNCCGACIGFERSKRFKEAGVRTHIIVCCAAALIMIISKYGFADLTAADGAVYNGTRGADPARVAAQAVSGISFLGAGVIFKNGNTVKGLTTAAGIWATAAIGLAVGAGMYWVGLFVTLLIAVFQISMHRFTIGADSFCTSRVQFTVSNGEEFAAELQTQLDKWRARVVSSELSRDGDGNLCYDLTLKTAQCIELDDIMQFMTEHEEIIRAEGVPVA